MKHKGIRRFAALFCLGGFCYNFIEILWRGYSHWSMFLVGGCCFHLIGGIGNRLRTKGALVVGTTCAVAITTVEYISGWIVNLRLKLNVWDYSHMFGNLHGQVCLPYTVLWGILSLMAIPFYRFAERRIRVLLK